MGPDHHAGGVRVVDHVLDWVQRERFVLPADVRGAVVMSGDPRGLSGIAGIAAILTSLAGCTPGPLHPPTHATPMNKPTALSSKSSSGDIEAARRVMEGVW